MFSDVIKWGSWTLRHALALAQKTIHDVYEQNV